MFRLKQTIAAVLVGFGLSLISSPALAAPYGTGGYGECQYQNNCSSAPSGGGSSSGGSTSRSGTSTGMDDNTGSPSEVPPDETGTTSPTSPSSTSQPRKIATLQDGKEKSFYERNKLAIVWLGGIGGIFIFIWLLLLFIKRRSRTTRPIF